MQVRDACASRGSPIAGPQRLRSTIAMHSLHKTEVRRAGGPFGPCDRECRDGSEPIEESPGAFVCPVVIGSSSGGAGPSCPGLIGEPCCAFVDDAGPCVRGAVCNSEYTKDRGKCVACGGDGQLACFESAHPPLLGLYDCKWLVLRCGSNRASSAGLCIVDQHMCMGVWSCQAPCRHLIAHVLTRAFCARIA